MSEPEVWLRGPIDGVPALLQPVAHSLLQCRYEVRATLATLGRDELWVRPVDAASAAYHVRHAIGSLDRLFTYARGEQLSAEQLASLRVEGDPGTGPVEPADLVGAFEAAVEHALAQVRSTPESVLGEERFVGRAKLRSTVLGLLFHAAEHTQRHTGQLVTTARFVSAGGRRAGAANSRS